MGPMLVERGHEVVGLDSDLFRECGFGGHAPKLEEWPLDIRDVQRSDLKGFEAVIHLAGLSNDPLGDLDPALTYEINYSASVRLAELARDAGVGVFLFSSSCSTYGAAGEVPLDENAEFRPVTPYAESKVLVERGLSKLAGEGFSPVCFRNATAYGVSPRLRFDLVLNNLVAWAAATGRVHIKSDGTPWRPLVHIEDISRAFAAALDAPRERIHNQAFNVGATAENYRVRELAEIVRQTVPGCQIEYAADAGPDKRCYRVNCDKLSTFLPAAKPQWDARSGAQQLYEAFKTNGVSVEDFEGSRFSRLGHIKKLIEKGDLNGKLQWTDRDGEKRRQDNHAYASNR